MDQDCADEVNAKCTVEGATTGHTWCVPVWGDAAVGESCTRPTGTPGLDTCEVGAYCGNFGQPTPQDRICWSLCEVQADCASEGDHCQAVGADGAGLCIPDCEPFGSDCNSANQCTWTLTPEGGPVFYCAFIGTAKEGESCASDTCAEGLWCTTVASGVVQCRPTCDDAHACAADQRCEIAIADAPHPGVCMPVDWSCVGGSPWPDPVAAVLDLELTVLDYADGSGDPFEGATIKVCTHEDPACGTPLATATSDATGQASIPVTLGATGFDGYVEVSAAGRVTILRTFNRPLTAENYTPQRFGLGDEAVYQAGYAPTGVTLDFTRGQVEVFQFDCSNLGTAGVEFAATGLDASSAIGYLDATAKVDDSLTDARWGLGVILNVPGATTTVTATRVSGDQVVATAAVPLRAGVFTELRLVPEP
jgi:hypothetical protein